MIDIQKCLEKYSISPKKIQKEDSYIILYEEKNTYLLKEKKSSKKELFSYFQEISYPYYVPLISSEEDDYELYTYIEDKGDHEKDIILVEALANLQKESLKEVDFSKEEKEEFYQKLEKKITNCLDCYENLQDYIHHFSFPRVDYYHLLNNISLFYQILFCAKKYLEEWNFLSFTKKRKALILHNASLKDFHQNKRSYFLNFDECKEDNLIQDLLFFFQEEIEKIDGKRCLEKYEEVLSLLPEEKKLFFCLLCIPRKVEFSSNLYENTVRIQEECSRIHKIFTFLSEEDKEDQKTNEEELKEQDKDIEFRSNKEKNK
ncbi:MAG: hypothetical protein IJI60_00130 [Bacilli bacterium]|nr:hypothetical protein [Bacilli bacterium]